MGHKVLTTDGQINSELRRSAVRDQQQSVWSPHGRTGTTAIAVATHGRTAVVLPGSPLRGADNVHSVCNI